MTFSSLPEMCQFDDRTNNDQLIVYLLKYTSVGSDILTILKGRHFINMKQLNTSMFFLHFSTYLIYSSCHFLTTVQYHVCFLFVLCYFLETQTFHSNYTTMQGIKPGEFQLISLRIHLTDLVFSKRQQITCIICLFTSIRIKAILFMKS